VEEIPVHEVVVRMFLEICEGIFKVERLYRKTGKLPCSMLCNLMLKLITDEGMSCRTFVRMIHTVSISGIGIRVSLYVQTAL
jgi:hypothetical protein